MFVCYDNHVNPSIPCMFISIAQQHEPGVGLDGVALSPPLSARWSLKADSKWLC